MKNMMRRIVLVACISACVPGLALSATAATRYVVTPEHAEEAGVTPTAPYTSWETAGTDIATVVAACAEGDKVVVRIGTYKVGTTISFGDIDKRKLDIVSYDPETGLPNAEKTILDGQGERRIMSLNAAPNHRNSFVVDGFTFKNGKEAEAGALRFNGGRLRGDGPLPSRGSEGGVYNCRFIGNEATTGSGGAMVVVYGAIVSNCYFEANTSYLRGGAVDILYANNVDSIDLNDDAVLSAKLNPTESQSGTLAVFYDCVFTNNAAGASGRANAGYGGAVEPRDGDKKALYLKGCKFFDNGTAGTGNRGGAVYAGYGSRLECCEFIGNSSNYGGGLFAGAACTSVSGCTFRANSGSLGGGICGCAQLRKTVIANNAGAGLFVFGTTATGSDLTVTNNTDCGIKLHKDMKSCSFDRCLVLGNGGCAFLQSDATASGTVLRNSLFAQNGATVANSYGLDIKASLTMENCTIADNANRNMTIAGSAGAYTVSLTNCVIAKPLGGSAWTIYSNGPEVQAASCYGVNAEHVTNVDPVTGNCLFAAPANGDYSIARKSCLRDAGAEADWMVGAVDLAGNSRVFGPKPDVGCYENQDPAPGLLLLFR